MTAVVVYLPRTVLSPELRKRVEATIERLIGLLDAVETPGEDLEPVLGATEFLAQTSFAGCSWHCGRHDADEAEAEDEHAADDDAGEESLGWPATVRQLALGPNTADGDHTAPERHGEGFVRCGADDYEANDGDCCGGGVAECVSQ